MDNSKGENVKKSLDQLAQEDMEALTEENSIDFLGLGRLVMNDDCTGTLYLYRDLEKDK